MELVSERTIDKHRHINVECMDWWDYVYETFRENMKEHGIDVEKMYFSGFWSQGDGACFEGRVEDWDLFLKKLGYTNHALIQHAVNNWSFKVDHSGHYYHENCTNFSGDLSMPDGYDNDEFIRMFSPYEGEFKSQAWLSVLTDGVHEDFESLFKDTFKDHMRTLYRKLQSEYDHLTSDEAVVETIIANDLQEEDDDSESVLYPT